MIGIYKITNLLSGQSYIGQSKNIEQRFKEHMYHNSSNIDIAIHELGVENFSFEILELCTEDQLDIKEDYYIQLYKSNIDGFGYNLIHGGRHNKGESNPNSKLTEQDVYNIRESYRNHEHKYEVYERYKHKISKLYFSNLWEGQSWKDVNYDVYTEENIDFYKNKTSIGQDSTNSVFTNLEVFELRKRYINESAKEIYESVKDRCSFQSLQMILWGRYYSKIIVYDKKDKRWVRK